MPRPMTRESLAAIHARRVREEQDACAAGHHKGGAWETDQGGRRFWDCVRGCGHRHRPDPAPGEELAAEENCAIHRRLLEIVARRQTPRGDAVASGRLVAVPEDERVAAGLPCPAAMTRRAWDRYGDGARLGEALAAVAAVIERSDSVKAMVQLPAGELLHIRRDRDDDWRPCLTVGLPGEKEVTRGIH